MGRSNVVRAALAVCLAALLLVPVLAEPTKIKVDGNIIKGYITYLASDAGLGRRTLTPGYEKAADWAAAKFKEWGLKPAGENGTYFQKVPISGARSTYTLATGVPSLVVNGRTFYVRDNDFTVDAQLDGRRGGKRRSRVRGLRHLGACQGSRRVRGRGREGQDRSGVQGIAGHRRRRRACSSRRHRPPRRLAPQARRTRGPRR